MYKIYYQKKNDITRGTRKRLSLSNNCLIGSCFVEFRIYFNWHREETIKDDMFVEVWERIVINTFNDCGHDSPFDSRSNLLYLRANELAWKFKLTRRRLRFQI